MKRYKLLYFILILITISLFRIDIISCTGCAVYRYGKAYFGNNEDYYKTNTYIEFLPAEDGKHGRVYLGYMDIPGPQGGMNDQGLCFDGFATPHLEVVNSSQLPMLPYNIKEVMMETCSTIEEVYILFSQYNLAPMAEGQLFVADRFGGAMIIEGDEVIVIEDDYLVCTNFYQSDPSLGGWPSWRYDTAMDMLSKLDSVSKDDIKEILDACHQTSGYGKTTYSNVFDMNTCDMFLYNRGNYDKEVFLNLNDELQNGYQKILLSELFSITDIEPGNELLNLNLEQNYPNPFNNGTIISYSIPQNSFVKITVTDPLGKKVKELVNDYKNKGTYETLFNSSQLSSGVYYYHLQTGNYSASKKMILLK